MPNDKTVSILLAVAFLAAVFLLGRCSVDRGESSLIEIVSIRRTTDTVVDIRYRDRQVANNVAPITARPQTPEDWIGAPLPNDSDSASAFVDSASVRFASGDTVDVAYAYPQRKYLSVMFRPRPDSIITIRDSVEILSVRRPSPISFGAFGGYGYSPTTNSAGWTIGVGILVSLWSPNL